MRNAYPFRAQAIPDTESAEGPLRGAPCGEPDKRFHKRLLAVSFRLRLPLGLHSFGESGQQPTALPSFRACPSTVTPPPFRSLTNCLPFLLTSPPSSFGEPFPRPPFLWP
jgi:hypothetical protein